ncbi:MAG TPA: PepSY domain-containing protein [Ramlibacter sp.]|jgi:uncharacterized membrane protein YkoI
MIKPAISLLALFAALASPLAFAAAPSQQELLTQARITRDEATRTALGKVPNGDVRTAELEREHGKLIWSFDIARPGRSGVTEIQVDAVTGKVASVKRESAPQEAREAAAESAHK